MAMLNFKVLGIEVESENNLYLDCGFVDDIYEFSEWIYKEMGIEEPPIKGKDNSTGRCLVIPTSNLNCWFTFYKDMDNHLLNTFIRAHEEAHVVHGINRLDLLQDKLNGSEISIDLTRFQTYLDCSEQELDYVATIMAAWAFEQAGGGVDNLGNVVNFYPEYVKPLDDYMKIKLDLR